MPERNEPPEEEGARELLNMSRLAHALGVTRQWLHALRVKDPNFPPSERPQGSTREVWDLAEVRAYYEQRELHPGQRTDLIEERKKRAPDESTNGPRDGAAES
jgi:predicted DNA-binding transcriptional regulator AlpA